MLYPPSNTLANLTAPMRTRTRSPRRPFAALALAGICCLGLAAVAAEEVTKENDTTGYSDGRYFLPAWTANFDFDRGGFTRTWRISDDGEEIEYLRVELEQTKTQGFVGFDAGVGRGHAAGSRVAEMAADEATLDKGVGYTFAADMRPLADDDFWIQGPKTVISSTPDWVTLVGEHECYIVDTASHDMAWIVEEYDLEHVASDTYDVDGEPVTYHHHVRDLNSPDGVIHQVFSFRDGWQSAGFAPTNRIMADWMKHEIVPGDSYNLGWKVNVETDGAFAKGSYFEWTDLELPDN